MVDRLLETSKCYEILGVKRGATPQEIKEAYRKLSLRYHPDRNSSDDKKFKEIVDAYQTIKNEQKRDYSRKRRAAESSYAQFWRYYEKNSAFHRTHNFARMNYDFNMNMRETTSNQEKPISQKMTHLILYAGLGVMTIWIILSEFLK